MLIVTPFRVALRFLQMPGRSTITDLGKLGKMLRLFGVGGRSDGSSHGVAFFQQLLDQLSADETACARHNGCMSSTVC